MTLRMLGPADAVAFQAVRLQGLAEFPGAFASSHEEEVGRPLEKVARRLEPADDRAVFGSFAGDTLCGVVGLQREGMLKLRHKANLWGMYVAPAWRRSGHGAALMGHALAHAWSVFGVLQVNLGAHTENEDALRLYRRFGFAVYGTERRSLVVDGRPQDEFHMTVWRDEPAT